MYNIISDKQTEDNYGTLTQERLREILIDENRKKDDFEYEEKDTDFIKAMLIEFNLAFQKKDDERISIIPAILDRNQPDDLHFNENDSIYFGYRFDFFPPSLFSALIVKKHNDLLEVDKKSICWRHGAVFESKNTKIKVTENTFFKTLDFYIEKTKNTQEVLLNYVLELESLLSDHKSLYSQNILYENTKVSFQTLLIYEDEKIKDYLIPEIRKNINVNDTLDLYIDKSGRKELIIK